ncbi:hypothetical protein [Rudanella lutea]|uniref:hypothetical protein n=1 Tax=Rudanella lutea TaxID=451374 RepID=UPI0003A7273E|nr:hypothetical protein [Rudanella lutea]
MLFRARPLTSDVADLGQLYRVQFFRRGYSGTVTELTAGREPWIEETEDKLIGVKAKLIRIGVICQTVDLASFYADNDRDLLVVLQAQQNNSFVTISSGWLNPFDATEPYQEAPYAMTLTAACGLGSLQDFPLYRYPSRVAYPEPITAHELLYNCLEWVGYPLPLRSWTGRYEESILVNGTDYPADTVDPLQYVKIDPRRWLRTDGTYESCKTVLDNLCTDFGAVLVQQRGVWCFLSLDAQTSPQKWHEYSASIVAIPALVLEPNNYQSGGTGDMRWEPSTSVGIVAQKKTVILNYDYGNPTNLVRNGDFSSQGANWTVNQLPGKTVQFEGDGEADNSFRVRVFGQSSAGELLPAQPGEFEVIASLRQSISMIRGSRPAVSQGRGNGAIYIQSDVHTLKLSGVFVNFFTAGAKVAISAAMSDGTVYWLQSDGNWRTYIGARSLTLVFVNTWQNNGNTEARPTKGETFDLTSSPVPGTGNYTLRIDLFAAEPIVPSLGNGVRSITYRDIRISLNDGTVIPLKGESWTVRANAGSNDRLRREELSMVLGDQIALSTTSPQALRYGAMLRLNGTPTKRWLLNGRLDRFQKLTGWSLLRWLSPKTRRMTGGVHLTNPAQREPGPLSVYSVADMNPPYAGIPTRWTWDVRMRLNRVILHELPISLIDETFRGSYETPDGVLVPIVEPADTTQPVPIPPNYTPRGGSGSTGGKIISSVLKKLFSAVGIVKYPNQPQAGPTGGQGLVKLDNKVINFPPLQNFP